MVAAGMLDRRVRFEKRLDVNDGAGNTRGEWVKQFACAAGRTFLRGGEGVLASRLESRQPVILTIRNSRAARTISADWRAIDERDGRVFNIRENPKESGDRSMLEMLAEAGVAT